MPGPVDAYVSRLKNELRQRGIEDTRIAEEAREHLIDAVEDGRQRGLSVDDAEREAFERFGTPESVAAHIARERDRTMNRFAATVDTVWRHKWWILAPTVVTAVVSVVISYYFLPVRYRSESPTQQPDRIDLTLSGEAGAPPRIAIPEFLALASDVETVAAAKTITQVLSEDLEFEREFYLMPRDTYASIARAGSIDTIPFDRWRELGADGVITGSVRRTGNTLQVEMRLFNVRAREIALGRMYDNVALRNPRGAAHTISDDIHQTQANLRGVARTKLTFISDRDNERVVDTVETRNGKEVYVADYDGANQMRVTANRRLNITPSWSPDGRSIAYSSYTRVQPQIIVSNVYQGTRETLTDEKSGAYMPVFSPDGSRIAFMSQRDGNPEIYVMNRNGSGVRRLTNNDAADSTPTWSPTGSEIAFTSDRTGRPQIHIVSSSGGVPRRISSGTSFADRATWGPAPYNEIAYASQSGRGFDIVIYNVATGRAEPLTQGEGSNESPVFSPNGRHIAFTSTRKGQTQIFLIGRDGKGLRQVTTLGNNVMPNWSR
jgi:TolB protein